MLNQNAVVSVIRELQPGFGGMTRLLLADERAVDVPSGEIDVLARAELLQWLGLPSILTLGNEDTAAPTVTSLEIPLVARVLEIVGVPEGHLIEFDRSAARHVLTRAREALLDPLTAAQRDGHLVVVQDDPYTHEILDVEPADGQLDEVTAALESLPAGTDSAATPSIADGLPDEVTPMRRVDADSFIRRMDSTESCGLPGSNADVCIPFRYPDDGCFARAHRMCTLLVDQGVIPGKIWIYGQRLVHRTENHPACHLAWTWHVAPAVRDADSGQALVIDPGLFDVTVDRLTWQNEMEDPTAETVFTTREPFLRSRKGRVTRESRMGVTARDETESYLRIYRQRLLDRKPPPPFPCPI